MAHSEVLLTTKASQPIGRQAIIFVVLVTMTPHTTLLPLVIVVVMIRVVL